MLDDPVGMPLCRKGLCGLVGVGVLDRVQQRECRPSCVVRASVARFVRSRNARAGAVRGVAGAVRVGFVGLGLFRLCRFRVSRCPCPLSNLTAFGNSFSTLEYVHM